MITLEIGDIWEWGVGGGAGGIRFSKETPLKFIWSTRKIMTI